MRGAGCLLETLASGRAAGTGREEPQPDRLAVKCGRLCVELRREAKSKKAPIEGVVGGEP